MARVVPPPPATKHLIEVVLDNKVFHVEAAATETLGDVRTAILVELGRKSEADQDRAVGEDWTLARPIGAGKELAAVEPGHTVDVCPQRFGFRFHLFRPGVAIDRAAELRRSNSEEI